VDKGWCPYWTSNPLKGVFGQILESVENKGIHANPLFLLRLPHFGLRLDGVGCLQ
jgi:hypothetical protein